MSAAYDFMDACQFVMPHDSCVVVTDQVRARRSVERGRLFAGGTQSAGKSVMLEFSVRLELSRMQVKQHTYTMLVNVEANTLRKPASLIEVPMHKELGVQTRLDLLRVAAEYGVVTKRGNWYHYGTVSLGQGEKDASEAIKPFEETLYGRLFG